MQIYLNQRTDQRCVIVEYTSETMPYCIVQYEDGTTSREHRGCLKRAFKATHVDLISNRKCMLFAPAPALNYWIVEYEDGHRSRCSKTYFKELIQ